MARLTIAAFIVAVTLSSALLFMVEPMVTKMLLPQFGGSAAVWSVAIVFFQAALLCGYLYAHLLTRRLGASRAAMLHLAVLAGGLLLLPIRIGPPQTAAAAPEIGVLITLVAAIGLPFVALAANAPLLQAWYAASRLPGAHDPYPLYAASNAGSLAALLAYPFLVEPRSPLSGQNAAWAAGYLLLIGVIAAALLLARPLAKLPAAAPGRIRWRDRSLWLALALVPSAGLVAVTAHLSADVASAPLLWVVPLALYLLSFVVVFSTRWSAGALGLSRGVLPLLLLAAALRQGAGWRFGLAADVALDLAMFLALSLVFHGSLAARRPEASGLTSFYLAMSTGGLIGGVAAAIVAPHVFSFVAEYPLLLVAAALATPWPRLMPALVIVALLLPGWLRPPAQERFTRRSFYGVHSVEVTPDRRFRLLRHGQEIHGAVRLREDDGTPTTGKPRPLTYYHEEGALSEAIDAVKARRNAPIRAAVVGLGTGSTACLVDPTDTLDFYEIDPEIVKIARDPALFGFIEGCQPRAGIVMGDARQSLGREGAPYDVIVVDAFSSDAIPVHLLTREAMQTYLRRLAPGGMLLLHISNTHLRFNEIVASTARSLGLAVRIFDEYEDADAPAFVYRPTIAALARGDADFGALAASDEWVVPDPSIRQAPWSDDFTSILAAIVAKGGED